MHLPVATFYRRAMSTLLTRRLVPVVGVAFVGTAVCLKQDAERCDLQDVSACSVDEGGVDIDLLKEPLPLTKMKGIATCALSS